MIMISFLSKAKRCCTFIDCTVLVPLGTWTKRSNNNKPLLLTYNETFLPWSYFFMCTQCKERAGCLKLCVDDMMSSPLPLVQKGSFCLMEARPCHVTHMWRSQRPFKSSWTSIISYIFEWCYALNDENSSLCDGKWTAISAATAMHASLIIY